MFWFETEHPVTGEALEVEAVYLPPWRGLRDAFGAPLEPDDFETVAICEVRNRAGERVEFANIEETLKSVAYEFRGRLSIC
jgi:hypothetical protein